MYKITPVFTTVSAAAGTVCLQSEDKLAAEARWSRRGRSDVPAMGSITGTRQERPGDEEEVGWVMKGSMVVTGGGGTAPGFHLY